MTYELRDAIAHVKKFHPTVSIVIFSSDGRWQYMDEDFQGFKFDNRIDVGILEAAADSIDNQFGFPFIHQEPLEY
jgi:hypothetical protein